MTAWLLAVVSSDQQAETLVHQRAWAEETARERGWTLERVFEGVSSGAAGPRRLLRELIAALRATERRPDWLLMIRADRVGRGRLVESQVALHEISDLGVRIWTRDGGELKLDSATDQIIAAVKAGLASLENEVRRDKAVTVYRRKRAAGLAIGNKRPYGLTIGPDGRDVVVPDQAETVRLAFTLRAEGLGYHAIAQRLLAGAAPYRYRTGERPVRWSSRRVRTLLANRAYVGTIVDEVAFHRAAQVRDELARDVAPPRNRFPWPLTGALRCYCGANLIGQSTGKKAAFRYYTCRAIWNHDGHYVSNRAEPLERQFAALLRELSDRPALIADYRQAAASGPSPALLDRALRKARAELNAIGKQRSAVWEMHAAGTVRAEHVQERLDALAARRNEITTAIAALDAQRAVAVAATKRSGDSVALITRAAEIYVDASVEDQRRIARAVALQLGGLCVERDHTLTVRRPEDPGVQRRLKRPSAG